MKLPLNIDLAGNIEQPTFVLSYKSGKRIGALTDVQDLSFENSLGNPSVFNFNTDKRLAPYWYAIKNFRLVWVPEWDKWFEVYTELNINNRKIKNITLTHLPESELSQLLLNDVEINTESDIEINSKDTDDYGGTYFYVPDNPKISLLHRITEKAVNFTFGHIDESLCGENREFSFDGVSIYDALQEIAQELNCIFIFNSYTCEDGTIGREISAYDLRDWCSEPSCLHREEHLTEKGICPECGCTKINSGYGEDTTIFFSMDNVLDDIGFVTDTDSVKNCFKLKADDEDLAAAIMKVNPNGTDYIFYISPELLEEMSDGLHTRIDEYYGTDETQGIYNKYNDTVIYTDANDDIGNLPLDLTPLNVLIERYQQAEIGNTLKDEFGNDIKDEDGNVKYFGYSEIVGYQSLTNLDLDVLDMQYFIDHEMMPSVDVQLDDTDAQKQAEILQNISNWDPGIAIQNLSKKQTDYFSVDVGKLAANNAIKKKAATLIDSRYSVEVVSFSISGGLSNATWSGVLKLENKNAPDEDFCETTEISGIKISGDYEQFIKQCIDISLSKIDDENFSFVGLFKYDLEQFKKEIEKYGITPLESMLNACEAAFEILNEQGIGHCVESTDENGEKIYVGEPLFDGKDLYNQIYVPYTNKKEAIETELNKRYEEYNSLEVLEEQIFAIRENVHGMLNFEEYIKKSDDGEKLWKEFNSFRREDIYSNSNYSGEDLSNDDILNEAKLFIKAASEELIKSATQQHSITSTVKNLIVIPEFEPLVKHFDVGNWIRIEVDEEIHKLRLLSYHISFDDFANIDVTFSDVLKVGGYYTDLESVVNNVKSMSSSYSYVQRQAEKSKLTSDVMSSWSTAGLDATYYRIVNNADTQSVTIDNHGILLRSYDEITDSYDPRQMRIVNSTIVITDNNWQSTKTAVGRFYYAPPEKNDDVATVAEEDAVELIEAYGINGEVIVGKLLLGEELGIYSSSGNNLTFDKNGLMISNGKNTFWVDPNNSSLFTISKTTNEGSSQNILSLDSDGNLSITGVIHATDGTFKGDITGASGIFNGTITSNTGNIGPWKIDSKAIHKTNDGSTISDSDNAFVKSSTMYFGNEGLSIANTFSVTKEGVLSAEGANITGTINATSIKAKDKYSLYVSGFGEKTILSSYSWIDVENYGFLFGDSNYTGAVVVSREAGGRKLLTDAEVFDICGGYVDIWHGGLLVREGDIECWQDITGDGVCATTGFFCGDSVFLDGEIANASDTFTIHSKTYVSLQANGYGVQIGEGFNEGNTIFAPCSKDGNFANGNEKIYLGANQSRWITCFTRNPLNTSSDERDKNIFNIDKKYLDFYMKLKPVAFTWKDDEAELIHMGFGAQSTEQAALSCGIEKDKFAGISHFYWNKPDETGRQDEYSLTYNEILMLTVPFVQDHEHRIELLEEKVKQLEQENKLLREAMV